MSPGWFVATAAIAAMMGMTGMAVSQAGTAVREMGRTFIVDQRGERWDVTQALSLGFDPEGFQYGIGRNAFTPLEDSRIRKADERVPEFTRVIGMKGDSSRRAYAVPTLWSHEIANSHLDGKPVAVGY